MKKERIAAIGLSLLTAATLMNGCGNSAGDTKGSDGAGGSTADTVQTKETASAEQTTITFSLWDEIQSVVYQELIDNFEAENPDIRVEMQLTPWDQYWTKFDAAAGANQAADVFFMNVWVPKYAAAGVLEPLDSYMIESGFDSGLYSPSIIESGIFEGKHYTIPKGTDSLAVMLNMDLFEKYGVAEPESGWTWKDMEAVCGELKEKIDAAGEKTYPMALMLNSMNGSWQPVIYQFGGGIFREDGTSGYDSEESIAAIQSLIDMIDKRLIPDYQTVSDTSAEELFISGQACMLYLPTFSSQKIEQAEMENIKLIQLPKADSQKFMAGNMHYGLNSASQHKAEAWKFLAYLAGEEANDIIGKSGVDLPARLSSQGYYADSFKQFDGMAFVEDLQYAVPFVSAPPDVSDTINSIQNDQIIAIFTKQIDAREGMVKMAAAINAEIEKGK